MMSFPHSCLSRQLLQLKKLLIYALNVDRQVSFLKKDVKNVTHAVIACVNKKLGAPKSCEIQALCRNRQ